MAENNLERHILDLFSDLTDDMEVEPGPAPGLDSAIRAALEEPLALEAEPPGPRPALAAIEEPAPDLAKRTFYWQTAAEVSRAVSSILSLDALLPKVVELIREGFGLYYAGIFLVDDASQWAVLQAGTGRAGRRMIEQGHRLEVGGASMIGWCVAHEQPRIALDVGEDAVRFDNPLLPATRSEMALPLISRGRAIGAMTIQSARPMAFGEEDIAVLQTMADQVATAIENARLFDETQRRLQELLMLHQLSERLAGAPLAAQEIATLVARQYIEVIGLQGCSVSTFDRETDAVTAVVDLYYDQDQERIRAEEIGEPFLLSDYPATRQVLTTMRPLVVQANDPQADPAELSYMQRHDTKTLIMIPLVITGQPVGLIELEDWERERHPTPEEISLAMTLANQAAVALENARLFESSGRQSEGLVRLNQLSAELAGEQAGLGVVLDTLARRTMEMLDSDGAGVWFWHPDSQELELVITYQVGQEDFTGRRLKPGEGLSGQAFATRTIQLVNDYQIWSDRPASFDQVPFHSALAAPMIWQNQPVGVLVMTRSQPYRPYTRDEQNLAALLSTQAASFVLNARLFEQTQSSAEELLVLNQLAQALTARLDTDQVLHEVLRGVSRLVDTANFYIGLYDPVKQQISFPINMTESRIDKEIAVIPADRGISGYIVNHKESVLIKEDVAGWQREHGIDQVGEQAASWLGVPLMLEDQVLGVMAVQSYSQSHTYDEHDRDMLVAIASQAAIAIQNARLFEQARQATTSLSARVRELDCLNEIGRKIDESPPVSEFLQWVADSIPPAMQYPQVCRVAIEHEGVTYGSAEAVELPCQMVGGLRVGGKVVGRVIIAYTEQREFIDAESALQGDIVRRISGYLENRQLLDQARHRAEELSTLNVVATAVNQSLELGEMFSTSLDVVLERSGFDAGLFSLFDPEAGQLDMVYQINLPKRLRRTLEEKGLAGTLCELVFLSGETIYIADAENQPAVDVKGMLAQGLVAHGLRAYAGLPVRHRGQVLGTICLFGHAPHDLADSNLSLLESIGNQIGVGVANAQLFRQSQAALAETETTYRRYLRQQWEGYLGATHRLHGYQDIPGKLIEAGELWLPEMEQAISQDETVTHLEPLDGDRPMPRSAIALPIRLRGQIIGVLDFYREGTATEWTEQDRALVETLADQLALALENARLFEQTERRAQRERLASELAGKIHAAGDMSRILSTAADELGRALGASRTVIRLAGASDGSEPDGHNGNTPAQSE